MTHPRRLSHLPLAKQLYRTSRDGARLYQLALYHRSEERRVQRWSRERLRARQWSRFRRLIEFATANVPYYRDRFREAGIVASAIGNPDDLLRIPLLTKDDLRRNFPDRMLRTDRVCGPDKLGRSSGSTGESVHFVRPDRVWTRSLHYAVLRQSHGLRNSPILVLTTPACNPSSCSLEYDDPENLLTNTLLRIPPARHLAGMVGLPAWLPNILTAPDDYMAQLAARIERHSRTVMIADPVYLGALARYLRRRGGAPPRLRMIITSYELLTPSLRRLLSEVFRCPVRTQYGASELTDIAHECEYGRLHVRMDHVLLETVCDGRPAAPGELARVLVTDLDNYNMPLIRYDIGDVATRPEGDCPCGRQTESLATIEGRLSDTIRVRERLLTPLAIDAIFAGESGIAAYHVVQEGVHDYQLSVMRDGERAIDLPALVQRAHDLLGHDSTITVSFVDEIGPRPSNKFRFVHSELDTVSL